MEKNLFITFKGSAHMFFTRQVESLNILEQCKRAAFQIEMFDLIY